MATKPSARAWSVKEQIIEDPVTGLSFQFSVVDGSDAPFRLRIFGCHPAGNREILFNAAGEEAGAGTAFRGACRPTWMRPVS